MKGNKGSLIKGRPASSSPFDCRSADMQQQRDGDGDGGGAGERDSARASVNKDKLQKGLITATLATLLQDPALLLLPSVK